MEPFERATKALRDEICSYERAPGQWMIDGGFVHESRFGEILKVILQAIREPDDSMCEAAWEVIPTHVKSQDVDPSAIWQAMLDDVLPPETETV